MGRSRKAEAECSTPGAGVQELEATAGFEPANRGFADPPLRPLGYVALCGLAAPRGFEPRFTDPKSAVLPLDEGASTPDLREIGAEDGTRTRDLHIGNVMLYQLSHFRAVTPMMVPRARFELATPRSSGACSTN